MSQDPIFTPPRVPVSSSRSVTVWIATGLVLALAVGAALRGYASVRQVRSLEASTAENALRHVLTATARPADGRRSLALPGTLRGQSEAALYARTNGYLQAWYKDLGDPVRRGEALAQIDAPEAEQELLQARAAREQVAARVVLASSSMDRWKSLRARDAVSQQELDERSAALRQARADLAAAKANVRRLEQLQSFRRIVAPFDGIVVRRNAEIGALVNAGNGGSSRELFQIAQIDPLRVTVAVPQAYAADVRVDQEMSVKLAERPGAPLKGKVARTAGAMDPESRAMSVEIELPNPQGKLLPGAYVEVGLQLRSAGQRLVVPASALQFRQDGPRLALVGEDGRIELRTVKLGRDLGKTVEIDSGLAAQERFVLNPPDTLESGEAVVATAAPTPAPQTAPGVQPAAGTASGPQARRNGDPS